MEDLFISNERKTSKVKGTGIQYIPGYIDPFVDFVIEKWLPVEKNSILDLGGGGFRFAISAAILNKNIIVVDLDPSGLDLELIYRRVNENGQIEIPVYDFLKEKIREGFREL